MCLARVCAASCGNELNSTMLAKPRPSLRRFATSPSRLCGSVPTCFRQPALVSAKESKILFPVFCQCVIVTELAVYHPCLLESEISTYHYCN